MVINDHLSKVLFKLEGSSLCGIYAYRSPIGEVKSVVLYVQATLLERFEVDHVSRSDLCSPRPIVLSIPNIDWTYRESDDFSVTGIPNNDATACYSSDPGTIGSHSPALQMPPSGWLVTFGGIASYRLYNSNSHASGCLHEHVGSRFE